MRMPSHRCELTGPPPPCCRAQDEFLTIYNSRWRDYKSCTCWGDLAVCVLVPIPPCLCPPCAATKTTYTSYLRRWLEYVAEQRRLDPNFDAVAHPVKKVGRARCGCQ